MIAMSYNNIFNHLEDIMKICIGCDQEFKPVGREKSCGLKCKIKESIKINDNNCWLYKNTSSGPYSKLRWNMKWYSAHRISYEIYKGEIPKGMWVCHACDTPKCINPDHLFIGSASDNAKDAFSKNRRPKGENNVFSKYTNDQVSEMKSLKKEGFTYDRLSRIFNCSISYLNRLMNKKLRIES